MMLVGTSSVWGAASLMGSDFPNGNWDSGIGLPCTLYLESKTYNFKVKENGTWYEDQNEGTMNPGDSWQFYNYSKGNTKLKITTAGYYTLSWNESTNTFSVVEAIATAYVVGGYYGGGDKNYSSGKNLTKQSNGTYSGTFSDFSGTCYFQIYDDLGRVWGCDYVTKNVGESVTLNTSKNNKVEYSLTYGISYIFSFDPSDGTFSVNTDCDNNPDFSVSLSKSEVAVGCTGVTASITGNDSPTVSWSSSKTSVATINSSTGAITIKAAGTTTIKATTTEAGGFCGGVEKTATLTVKSPSVTVKPNDNSLCEGETLTLTATLTNCGSGNSIQWYNGVNLINGANSTTLTISSVTTANSGNYKAVVSGGILCSNVESTPIAITVNALPNAPGLKTASSITVCPGNLTLANYVNVTAGTTVKWYSNEDCTNEATSPSITAGESKNFYAKAVNSTTGCVSSGKTKLSITAYSAPNDFTLTAIPTEICSGADVVISIGNKQDGVTYKLGNETISESITVNPTDDTEYTVTASLNACPALTKSISTEIITVHPIPSFTVDPTNLSLCKGSTSETDLTELSHVEVANGNPVWYDAETAGNVVTTGADLVNGGTYWVAAENAEKGCVNQQRKSFTLTIHDLPASPTLNNTSAAVCQADKTVNLNTLAGVSGVNWYDSNSEPVTNGNVSITTAGTYTFTAKAVNGNGCQSATGAEFELTVNPLPTITAISVNNSTPVINEDVLLTVEGGDIARVEWSITSGNNASLSDASDYSVKLTSTTSGAVTVTATATSANGCTSTSTKEVIFSETEDCEDDIDYDNEHVEIWLSSSLNTTMYLHRWYENGNNDTNITAWPGASTTKSNGYYKWVTTSSGNIGYIFHDYTNNNKSSDANKTLEKGYRYYFTFNGGTGSATFNKSERITTTTPKPITAPAVKTVSANSEQGSGVVNFTGQIIKTGCAAKSNIYYGYQFKKADEEWPTTGVEASNTPVKGKLIPLTNASETALYYQFSANVENLEDGDYHFRAYIINGYDFTNGNYDQGVYYGLDKLVTVSTVQTPVTTATIQLTDANGTPVANDKKYCVGETGYIKVTSDVKYTTIQWETDKGTEIDVNGNNGIYSFVAKGDDNIWVMLSNRHNNPESPAINENPLVINTFADPILPRVSLNKVSICSNDAVGATVKLTNVVKGQTYQLYQQIDNGDDTFTEQAIGDAKKQIEEVTDKTELVLHTLTNTAATGKYFVKTYTEQCTKNMAATQPFTFTVVDAAEVFISLEPISAETTPWMPAKFTVNASDKYTLNVTKGNPAETATEAEVSQNGNNVSVKIPLPQGSTLPEGTTDVYGQYENVVFPQDATTSYTVTAKLVSTGGEDNPCASPASATITLTPYVEECTIGHE